MDSQLDKTTPKPVPEKSQCRDLAETSGDLTVDVASLATMPDALFEAGVHLAMDELHEQSRVHPLNALGGILDLMVGLNAELIKAYAPPVITSAQTAATEAFATQKPVIVSKEQARAVTALLRVQESLVKLGAARVKVADEQARRLRNRADPRRFDETGEP